MPQKKAAPRAKRKLSVSKGRSKPIDPDARPIDAIEPSTKAVIDEVFNIFRKATKVSKYPASVGNKPCALRNPKATFSLVGGLLLAIRRVWVPTDWSSDLRTIRATLHAECTDILESALFERFKMAQLGDLDAHPGHTADDIRDVVYLAMSLATDKLLGRLVDKAEKLEKTTVAATATATDLDFDD